jgi:hypothetical protein
MAATHYVLKVSASMPPFTQHLGSVSRVCSSSNCVQLVRYTPLLFVILCCWSTSAKLKEMRCGLFGGHGVRGGGYGGGCCATAGAHQPHQAKGEVQVL